MPSDSNHSLTLISISASDKTGLFNKVLEFTIPGLLTSTLEHVLQLCTMLQGPMFIHVREKAVPSFVRVDRDGETLALAHIHLPKDRKWDGTYSLEWSDPLTESSAVGLEEARRYNDKQANVAIEDGKGTDRQIHGACNVQILDHLLLSRRYCHPIEETRALYEQILARESEVEPERTVDGPAP
ncbi:hypothetical protein [Pseudomonas putida]|uniref:Uncharacterized protein n=1 Tax=Pseudomonas putida TaxID=303 RepID=A0A8I1EA44_PSEPU|nr:hypothetical protein [Pseudomonas putida]MBI6882629.1 hypothetical protein [Pseudomonas putida]